MRARNPDSRSNVESNHESSCKLLLVRDGHLVKSDLSSELPGTQQHYAGSLLEALARLESGIIDIVVLGAEFREEERTLFLLDAQRRGFKGPILHVVSAGPPTARSYLNLRQNADMPDFVPPSFTAKEQAVFERVAGGWTNLEVAKDLQCSEGTVKAILQQLFSKLGVRKRSQIVRLAFEQGLSAAQLPPSRTPQA